jgi:hypothetical protein
MECRQSQEDQGLDACNKAESFDQGRLPIRNSVSAPLDKGTTFFAPENG